MNKIEHAQLKETLYQEKLPNGLNVFVVPKQGFQKTYAIFTTRYGAIDHDFQPPGKQRIRVPDGIAHFLEHKMFEQRSGEDVFQQFALQGAAANAYTSFTRTAYLYSCTENVEKNLTTLLDFVQEPYFTDENVEKEKGIIAQEIRMYDDTPDWRLYFGLIQAFYQQHPVKIDIAGTVESIYEITKEHLYQCYETFYHPSNMVLVIVGSVQPEQIIQLVAENQAKKNFTNQAEIKRFFEQEPDQVRTRRNDVQLAVGVPKCMFGFKERASFVGQKGDDFLRQELSTFLFLEYLFGQGSDFYQSLYDDGLIDEQFGYDYSLEDGFAFSMAGGDSSDPERLLARVEKEVPGFVQRGLDQTTFDRLRKKRIGSTLRLLNSPEWIANQYTRYQFAGTDLFRMIPLLEELTVDQVNERMREHVDFEQFATSVIKPSAQVSKE
ncbi:EF-P 5-aminopentanol modification-associated protein YfmH [Seinonella peptonophila]|uniref:EF-P 5-aminopentanol modification-associated protein YfmH n=1 Tax=Seinonella peptonophila TaxID=112248 RepID=UPI000933EB6C|nr:pitrilysin family protein [Seinonella peptonophila]